jgi:hypothetical protein
VRAADQGGDCSAELKRVLAVEVSDGPATSTKYERSQRYSTNHLPEHAAKGYSDPDDRDTVNALQLSMLRAQAPSDYHRTYTNPRERPRQNSQLPLSTSDVWVVLIDEHGDPETRGARIVSGGAHGTC